MQPINSGPINQTNRNCSVSQLFIVHHTISSHQKVLRKAQEVRFLVAGCQDVNCDSFNCYNVSHSYILLYVWNPEGEDGLQET